MKMRMTIIMKTKMIIKNKNKPTTDQIIKIMDKYLHSEKDMPKHRHKSFNMYLYRILKAEPNFIEKFRKLKKKEPNYIDITNAYFNMGGKGLFKGFRRETEKKALSKIREIMIKKYDFDYEPSVNFDGEIEEDDED